ncbi:MAG: hypothetical protein H8D49_00860, partial [Dehalococcoidia bacterium]|nr:hypothetical protein [Dehalococcoidia bacterium]
MLPVILLPAAFVWYLNAGGVYAVVKEARKRRTTEVKEAIETEKLATHLLVEEQFRIQRTKNWH